LAKEQSSTATINAISSLSTYHDMPLFFCHTGAMFRCGDCQSDLAALHSFQHQWCNLWITIMGCQVSSCQKQLSAKVYQNTPSTAMYHTNLTFYKTDWKGSPYVKNSASFNVRMC